MTPCDAWSAETFISHQAKISSQNGEDGVLLYLLTLLPRSLPKLSFEVGASLVNGNLECNTAILLNNGWKGKIVDREEIRHPLMTQKIVIKDNINSLIFDFLPDNPSVVSIDTDGIDYYLWSVMATRPAVVIIEYNAHLSPESQLVIPYDQDFRWDGSDYFGASAGAMVNLGRTKGYVLVTCVHMLNLFFVRKDLVPSGFEELPLNNLGPIYRHPTRSARSKEYVSV